MVRPPFAALVVVAAALALTGCSAVAAGGGTPSVTPTPTATHRAALDIHVGDCLDDANVGTTTASAPVVPCSGPHDSEAFASFVVTGTGYPGDSAIQADAQNDCTGTAFADFVGIASSDSQLQVSYYFPTQDSWAGGDRTITCTVYQVDDAGKPLKTTGTLKDSAR